MAEERNILFVLLVAALLSWMPARSWAQIGEHRDDLAVGGGAGVVFSSVGFKPKVPQGMHLGPTFGVAGRYVCEKYYTMVCSVMGEVNFASVGWKEYIRDKRDNKVINRHRKRKKESRHDSRSDIRENNFSECVCRRRPKVQRCFIGIWRKLCELWHYGKHHIGDAERYMRK